MNEISLAYEQIIERFVAWAQPRLDIRVVIVIGSRARLDHPADEWSDLDIVMFVTDPEPYLTQTDWLDNMGDIRITFVEPTTGGEKERRVLFDGGLDVDFAVIPYAKMELMLQYGVPPEVAGIFHRGMRVLLDREGSVSRLNATGIEPSLSDSPVQAEFLEAINDFWYHAVWTAKKFKRGELWTAKACADGYMKRLLLKMIEWRAATMRGGDRDVWHDGRFLEQWADPRVLEGLRDAFAHYDHDDVRRALLATMDLFRWLAKETAERLACRYPESADEYATGLVNTLLSQDIGNNIGGGA